MAKSFNPVSELESWYRRARRKLPWRQTTDPYKIWVSEVMLQQTQVATVHPFYERFVEELPTLRHLAEADESQVMELWAGLGYYTRARNLQKGAKHIVENCDGQFPETRETLLAIPGIGPYTAGAIASIAYNHAEAIVDGNVQRVFARFFGFDGEPQKKETQDFYWQKAKEWVDQSVSPRIFNQSLMELGATICQKSKPRCRVCTLARKCVAFRDDLQDVLPKKKPRRPHKELWWIGLIYEHKGKVLLQKNPKDQWWAELWDLPRVELENKNQAAREFGAILHKQAIQNWRPLGLQRHVVTHHKIRFLPYLCKIGRPKSLSHLKGKWFPLDDLPATSSLVSKVLNATKAEQTH